MFAVVPIVLVVVVGPRPCRRTSDLVGVLVLEEVVLGLVIDRRSSSVASSSWSNLDLVCVLVLEVVVLVLVIDRRSSWPAYPHSR